jgi:spoIIIJ-associated protein
VVHPAGLRWPAQLAEFWEGDAVREVRVHAASREEALADGAAALGVDPRLADVEILSSDEDGVTARVIVADEPPAAVESAATDGGDGAPDQAESEAGEPAGEPEVVELARRHLQTMLDLMGVDAQAELAGEDEDEVSLNIVGHELGVVIGSSGNTLNAIQFLLNLMVNRGGRRRRVVIDAEGYRERRRQRLEEIARDHARRAKQERRDVILEGLRAAERRIIHTALQHDPDVVTYSEGEEPHRRLIISPRA